MVTTIVWKHAEIMLASNHYSSHAPYMQYILLHRGRANSVSSRNSRPYDEGH